MPKSNKKSSVESKNEEEIKVVAVDENVKESTGKNTKNAKNTKDAKDTKPVKKVGGAKTDGVEVSDTPQKGGKNKKVVSKEVDGKKTKEPKEPKKVKNTTDKPKKKSNLNVGN